MFLTWLDSNSWLIEVANLRILLDPWLVGSLTFGGAEWFFKGERRTPRSIPDGINLILLSQGLPDHAHPPTLAQLDRSIPVVASPGAAKIVKSLNYQEITSLTHHEKTTIGNQLTIEALPGSPVGPNTQENGYLITDHNLNITLYYEPHGYHDSCLQTKAPVDVVVTPTIDLVMPILGPVLKGQASALQVCQWLHPQILVPTGGGGDMHFQGLLLKLLTPQGTTATLDKMLQENNLSTQILEPTPWQRFSIQEKIKELQPGNYSANFNT